MKQYKHAARYKWTTEELADTIKHIKSADFKVEDINADLHKRVAAAVALAHFTSHNMRESDLDGDQDLVFWLRSLEDVLRELLADERMEGISISSSKCLWTRMDTESLGHQMVLSRFRLHRFGVE